MDLVASAIVDTLPTRRRDGGIHAGYRNRAHTPMNMNDTVLLSSIASPSVRRPARRRTARQAPARDHAAAVIDLHCHLLPAIDDGPRDMRTALAMARAHLEAGVTTVAVSWDLSTDAAAIQRGLAELRLALKQAEIPLHVVSGAEIDVHRAAELSDEELGALALGGGRWLLLEAPLQRAIPLEPVVHDLLRRGHLILLAHPERSPALQRDPGAVARLARDGVLTQVTASSFVGRFGRTVQRFAEQLVDEGLVHTVASDAHDPLRRPPGMLAPLAQAGLGALAPLLGGEIPAAILAGDPIPPLPARPRRRRGLRTLLGGR
jgi:protein-tyrosine phosphatase